MKITCLCENTPYSDEFLFEHGLSLYIETTDKTILFDTGQSDVFLKNAKLLGIDLSKVDLAILSHGHYDHGGGISVFLENNKKAKIYISSHAFEDYHNASEKYIGLDKGLINNDRIVLVDDYLKLSDNLSIYSCNDRELVNPIDSAGLTVKTNGVLKPDKFIHEQYLKIEEKGKTYLISGCSHKGILNIEEWFKPDFLIGGFHYMKQEAKEDNEVLINAAKNLSSTNTIYYTCHCTGVEQFNILKKKMGDKVNYLSAGQIINI